MRARAPRNSLLARAQLLLVLLLLCCPCGAQAADRETPLLHAMFQDHMVLQRDAPIRVWGHAAAGAQLTIKLASGSTHSSADANGRWEAMLPALPAGGPHALSVTSADGATQTAADVLMGDVWLCSGQSNMVLQVKRTLDSRAEMADAHNDAIRMLAVGENGSVVPLETFAALVHWLPTTPENVPEFSATCFYFARELQKTVAVPMGLINAAWGGSRIQAWMSAQALRATGQYNAELDVLALYANDPVAATGRWGKVWAAWWRQRPGVPQGDAPWSDALIADAGWRNAPRELGAWEYWGVPELADFNGMVWYRTKVKLTARQAAQGASVAIGAVDEIDQTWVNGRSVGSSYGADVSRTYPLPRGLLHEGENLIVVNALDTYRDGGMVGPASARALRFDDGTSLPLDAAWQYRMVPKEYGAPPQAPWQSASGLSTLYNGMIAPIGRYGLRGFVWYQGESNTFEPARYGDMLRAFRDDWRARFGADLPLLLAQLANYGAAPTKPSESDWAQLRDMQRRVASEDVHTGLAVTIDIGDRYDLHPPNKQELGRRLARAARHMIYGETSLPPSGPVPRSVQREGDAVMVAFGDVTGALVAYGADGPIGFELCGAQPGSCRYASAEIKGVDVILRAATASAATRVRYCWADSPVCTLFDGAGLPAGPFEQSIAPVADEKKR